ncbi:GGDEF domain-containing protein [Campylobacter gastrosuis]|uniref:diguanylate cyclase n=1 Tax=Campylobacter gastrosuis TaxID=2974576 RepID=A0ABT7HS05_9BACT|nr:GGDEF domain-containing protein [Campylobacter gastrosuis]MDL0089684.1 GGDEF domain-containing protein [Campylobacter gastrosuis]
MLKPVFVWGREFETDFHKIDTEHRYLVEIINTIGRKIAEFNPRFEDLEPIFTELFNYTKYHFINEETIMKDANVDKRHIKEHLVAHKTFIREVTSQYERIDKTNIKESAKGLLDFLVQWLTFHILGMDKNLTTQIKLIESGYSPEDAFNEINGVNHEQLDTLVKSFNGIFGVLMKYNDELLVLKKSLEDKVEERTTELQEANERLEAVNKQLEFIAMHDQLTGLANRHKTMFELEKYWDNYAKNGENFSVIMLDLDNFKGINDTYGHDAGDAVLKSFAKTLSFSIRTDDLACRLGGDEFFIICPNTDKNGVLNLAQKLHKNIVDLKVEFENGSWSGISSIGIATTNDTMSNKEDLIKASDNAVYEAKRRGKNQIFAI